MSRPEVKIYTVSYCGYCRAAKELLTRYGVGFTEIDVTADDEQRRWLVSATGQKTVPQVFWNGTSVGGYSDLRQVIDTLLRENEG